MVEDIKKEKCCGCRACEQICPQKCISMVEDEDGFFYPKIDLAKCIHCNLCQKVCPMIHAQELKNEEPKCYMLIHKKAKVVEKSSSGGAFTALVDSIANRYPKKPIRIYGCYLDEQFMVKHKGVSKIEDIECFRKSKYVQSNTQDTYSQVKQDLKDEKVVIYVGTPCQIAGLKEFTKNIETQNLYLIDLVCHGVPSQKMFTKYIESLGKKYKGKVKDFEFRTRKKIANKIDATAVKFTIQSQKDNKCQTKEEYCFENEYMRVFYQDLLYRPSCLECPFATPKRVSDITIADFWGIEKIHKEMDVDKGISLVLINSKKAEEIVENLKAHSKIEKADYLVAKQHNHNLQKPSKRNSRQQDFIEVAKKYTKEKSKLQFLISANMKDEIKDKIKKIIRKER